MKASVTHSIVVTMRSGSKDNWGIQTELTVQTRTSQKELFEAVKTTGETISNTVEESMKVGGSFPFGPGSIDVETSSDFANTVTTGIKNSMKSEYEYESESSKVMTTTVSQGYFAYEKLGEPMKVVYKEVWKIGGQQFKVVYLNCDEAESKEEGSDYHERDVTMEVAADHVWYRIKAAGYLYLSAGLGVQKHILGADYLDRGAYDQQWAFENGLLVSRSGKTAFSYSGEKGWNYFNK